jgi:hypothetical protein
LGFKEEAVNANKDPTITTIAMANKIVYLFVSVLVLIIMQF